MSYLRSHAIVVTDRGYGDALDQAHAFATSLGAHVTPVVAGAINHVRSFALLPDGSKEGWLESVTGDEQRSQMRDYLRSLCDADGSSPVAWVEVQFGDDEHETIVIESSDHDALHRAAQAGAR